MKVFIGGASEDCEQLREIESWIAEQDHNAWPWDKPGTFTIGVATFPRLIEISREVEAAVLVFSPADKVYYRGDATGQPRDNVLIEYGLFAGALGPERCAIAIVGDSKMATDLAGISSLDFRGQRKARGRIELGIWLRSLSSKPIDPAVAKQLATIRTLRDENDALSEHLAFEQENSRLLKSLLQENKIVNFSSPESNAYWKLLFDYEATNSIADGLKALIRNPQDLRRLLDSAGAEKISAAMAWGHADHEGSSNLNPQENGKFCRKALRALKLFGQSDAINSFVENSPPGVAVAFNAASERYYGVRS